MINLKVLHINDTELSLNHLPEIFQACPNLKGLSFSLSEMNIEHQRRLQELIMNNVTGAREIRYLRRGFRKLKSLKITDTDVTQGNFWLTVARILM